MFTNKSASVGSNAFYRTAPVYLHADSSWKNRGGGTKVPFITSLSAADVTVYEGDNVQASFRTDQSTSNAYIPSVTWTSSDTSVATLNNAATGKGVLSNTVKGKTDGTATVTVAAAQVGSDIFGAAAVPAIPSTTFNVNVEWREVSPTGVDLNWESVITTSTFFLITALALIFPPKVIKREKQN